MNEIMKIDVSWCKIGKYKKLNILINHYLYIEIQAKTKDLYLMKPARKHTKSSLKIFIKITEKTPSRDWAKIMDELAVDIQIINESLPTDSVIRQEGW